MVPVHGLEARKKAVVGITDLCGHLGVPGQDLRALLHPSLVPEPGLILRQLQSLSKFLSQDQYIWTVGKTSGDMGFLVCLGFGQVGRTYTSPIHACAHM